MAILEDRLIERAGTYKGYIPPSGIHKKGSIVPRIFPITIRQKPITIRQKPKTIRQKPKTIGEDIFINGFEFIGTPVDESRLEQIRRENGLSQNYGVVILPKHLLKGVNPKATRLIVEEIDENYIVAGLMPSENLRRDLRRITFDEEGIVYAQMSDFPTLNPQDLIAKWANYSFY